MKWMASFGVMASMNLQIQHYNKISDLTEQPLRTFKSAFFHASAEIIV